MATSCCETPSEAGRGVHRWRWVALTHIPQLHQCRTQWTTEPPREPVGSPSRRQRNGRVHGALLCASCTCRPRQAVDLCCPPARPEVTLEGSHAPIRHQVQHRVMVFYQNMPRQLIQPLNAAARVPLGSADTPCPGKAASSRAGGQGQRPRTQHGWRAASGPWERARFSACCSRIPGDRH